jgi:membrane-bound lytic murein transglycosylase B
VRRYPAAFMFLLLLCAPLLSGYSNCDFRVGAYETICKKALEKGVSIDYANRYLLAPQSAKRDAESLRLFAPAMISVHHANEKRANNALVEFIPEIVKNLRRYRAAYDTAEKRFGVNREVIASILAKETRLGRVSSKHDAFTVFNTLVRELPSDTARNRALIAMAERNIVALMHFCYANGIEPGQCRFNSSYAGAVGIPQFMPQNFHLITSYGSGPGNLETMEDAILSTARFLHVNAGFKRLIDWTKMPEMARIENAWYDYDFAHDRASFAFARSRKNGRDYNCFACGKPELAYLCGYVKKIMRYNNSSNYAVGVLRLAYDAHKSLNGIR